MQLDCFRIKSLRPKKLGISSGGSWLTILRDTTTTKHRWVKRLHLASLLDNSFIGSLHFQIPGPLTDEMESERRQKEVEKKKAQRKARKQRMKVRPLSDQAEA